MPPPPPPPTPPPSRATQIALDDIAYHIEALLGVADTAVLMTGTPAASPADYQWRTSIPVQAVRSAVVEVPPGDVLVQVFVPCHPKRSPNAAAEHMSYRCDAYWWRVRGRLAPSAGWVGGAWVGGLHSFRLHDAPPFPWLAATMHSRRHEELDVTASAGALNLATELYWLLVCVGAQTFADPHARRPTMAVAFQSKTKFKQLQRLWAVMQRGWATLKADIEELIHRMARPGRQGRSVQVFDISCTPDAVDTAMGTGQPLLFAMVYRCVPCHWCG